MICKKYVFGQSDDCTVFFIYVLVFTHCMAHSCYPWDFLSCESDKGFFLVLMRWLLESTLGWGLVARGADRVWLEGWNFQSSSPPHHLCRLNQLPKADGLNKSWLSNEAFSKTQKDRVQRASRLNTWGWGVLCGRFHLGECCAWRGHGSPLPVRHTLPCASLPLGGSLVISFCNKLEIY